MNIHPSNPRPRRKTTLTLIALMAGGLLLGGCASFSPDGGFAEVEKTAKERLGKDLRWARSDADRTAIDQRVQTRAHHLQRRQRGQASGGE